MLCKTRPRLIQDSSRAKRGSKVVNRWVNLLCQGRQTKTGSQQNHVFLTKKALKTNLFKGTWEEALHYGVFMQMSGRSKCRWPSNKVTSSWCLVDNQHVKSSILLTPHPHCRNAMRIILELLKWFSLVFSLIIAILFYHKLSWTSQ